MSMAKKIELHENQTLVIVMEHQVSTPFGLAPSTAKIELSYQEILGKFTRKRSKNKLKTEGVRFSRQVNLVAAAIKKGTWATGAAINKKQIIESLLDRFAELPESEYHNITKNAANKLYWLCGHVDVPGELKISLLNVIRKTGN